MKAGFAQTAPIFGDVENNLEHVASMLEGVEADLLVLPELFASGYLFSGRDEAASFAEEIPSGGTAQFLLALSSKLDCAIVAGLPEKAGGRLYNSSMAALPDGSCHVYRKAHLFDREKELFDPGDTGFFVFEFRGARLGMMICFDWIFPEAARSLALAGADIICHPSNLVLPHCPYAMITRCLENRVFSITANRIGSDRRGDDELHFIGNSRLISPLGEVLASAGADKEAVETAEISIEQARQKMVTERNHVLRDRRIDLYRLS